MSFSEPTPLIAKDQTVSFDFPLVLDSGRSLPSFNIRYQSYGQLNRDRSNAILVFHPFSKNAHAAGVYSDTQGKPGWWDCVIGPGKTIDTQRYFVVCSHVLGGSAGTTGPSSINPGTGKPYAMDFPVITIGDMVTAQKHLMDALHIPKWAGIAGGCFGGEQALEWLARYPECVNCAVMLSVTPSTSAHTIALSTLMRKLICDDPNWNGGDYYGKSLPLTGLQQALLTGFPVWMSKKAMEMKFGRKRRTENRDSFTMDHAFEVQFAMETLGEVSMKEMDPNSLLYLSKAAEYFDLPYYYGNLENAFSRMEGPALLISYQSDWRYPPEEVDQIHTAMLAAGKKSSHFITDHPFGHGSFVFAPEGFAKEVAGFFESNC